MTHLSNELGYVEGENLVIEARWAEGHYDRLPALMTEVLARKLDVLVIYGASGAVAAKNATSAIPIVGVAMGDPLRTGLVTSLAQPEGNLTGLSELFSLRSGRGEWQSCRAWLIGSGHFLPYASCQESGY